MNIEFDCSYDKMINVKELTPHPQNNNTHSAEQLEWFKEWLIANKVWRYPVVVSNRSGFIISGHGRLMVAELIGLKEVPVDYQDFKNEAEEVKQLTFDNEIARHAKLDEEKVKAQMLELDLTPFDLGIQEIEIPIEKAKGQCDEDEVPEVAHPITKRGDIWLLGNHRVMCGDSTMIDDVEKLMNGEKADMVYTDPPYGMSLDVNYDKMFKDENHKSKGDRFNKVIADDSYFDPQEILAVTSDVKEVWLWGADYFYDSLPRGGSMCSWDKRTENLDKVVGNTAEFLWSKQPHRRMTARVLWSGHHGMGKDDDKKRIHPTQKPITLHDWFFKNFGNNKNKIMDLFLGSGSTLIACEKTKRKCYGMELDEKYCDVIINRWQNYSGKKAVLESSNEEYNELKGRSKDA